MKRFVAAWPGPTASLAVDYYVTPHGLMFNNGPAHLYGMAGSRMSMLALARSLGGGPAPYAGGGGLLHLPHLPRRAALVETRSRVACVRAFVRAAE
jgi:hypothetical protein